MSDPKRLWDDDGDLNADERRLLAAGLRPNVPRGAKRAVWVALGAQLPAAVAAASASSGGLTAVALLKSAGLGLVIGATTMGGVAFVQRETAPPANRAVPAPARPSSLPLAPRAAPPAVVPAPPEEVPAPSAAVDPPSPAAARPFTEPPALPEPKAAPSVAAFPEERAAHDRESQRVARARQLLRAARPGEALGVLAEIARDFPNGELTQEREALAIEALLLEGDRAGARQRAQAFLARYPKSPHAPVARRALE